MVMAPWRGGGLVLCQPIPGVSGPHWRLAMLSRAICCRVALSVAGFAVCCPVPRQSDDRLEWLRVIRRSTACWFKVDFTSSSGLNSRPRRPWRWSHSRLRRGAVVKVSQWCRSRSRFLAGHGSLFGPLSERRAVALTTMGGTTVHCGSQFSVPLQLSTQQPGNPRDTRHRPTPSATGIRRQRLCCRGTCTEPSGSTPDFTSHNHHAGCAV
jgi:hypothetical protein